MNKIDLAPEQIGSLCLVCESAAHPAVLQDRELGPLCQECFIHALRATVALRWAENMGGQE